MVACGGAVTSIEDGQPAAADPSKTNPPTTSTTTPTPTTTATTVPPTTPPNCKAPALHRASATACDDVRPSNPVSTQDGPEILCTTHAECTAGKNGRCLGNSHDGWRCTYDACLSDTQCGGSSVCECEGGFRSDHNVCLKSECQLDSDCKGASAACGAIGFCSPSLGSCGHYAKAVGYFCHTPKDECTDDTDCAGNGQFGQKPYCSFDSAVGHWKCSTQECAG